MPIHDWTRVQAGIFHDFHHAWIEQIKRTLNEGVLPDDYYAMAEQFAAGFGPDVLTLQVPGNGNGNPAPAKPTNGGTTLVLAAPPIKCVAETDMEFYRRKQNTVTVRHVSGDRVVAMVEVVSPGNKSRLGLGAFLNKAGDMLDKQIHLLILDVHPLGRHDPHGIHAALWESIADQGYTPPANKPLTLASYESGLAIRAYVEPTAVGQTLADMPLFLEPGAHVVVPLEATYQSAFAAVPKRWRSVLEAQ